MYQSIHLTRNAPHVDHFRSKALLEDAIMESGLNYVFVSPNNFFQNDFTFFRTPITDYQLYIQPLGSVGVSRVDVRDIAEAVVNVLETTEFDRMDIPLLGPEAVTAEQTAEILTDMLGCKVSYAGDDLERFKETLYPFAPKWQVDDWANMYEFFQKDGLKATKAEITQLTNIARSLATKLPGVFERLPGTFPAKQRRFCPPECGHLKEPYRMTSPGQTRQLITTDFWWQKRIKT